ncbi:MAG: plasma-membrane proton-efflux P-type ATPase [Candidatus Micrarchaeaceae archaeon]
MDAFKDMALSDAFAALRATSAGLSSEEARSRLEKNGYNEIKEKKESNVTKFLKKLAGPVPIILWVTFAISIFLNNIPDAIIILALLFFNAIVGFFEEYKADKAIELLMQKLSVVSRVMRDGKWINVPSRELVPGDIIRIRGGDIIPADAKIIECQYLETDESVITGESLPISKQMGDIVYTGAVAKRGEATCLVISTGYRTFYGKTAKLVETAHPESHLQKDILHIVKYLIIADISILIVMFIYGVLILQMPIMQILPFLLILLMASVPVALPPTFTVSMAYGTSELAKKNVLVSKLPSIEEFSRMNILCLDKTGTLTENKLEVKDIEGINASNEQVLKYASEASRIEDNDAIDNAIIAYASANKIAISQQKSFIPFDPLIKRTEATVLADKEYKVTKGAVPIIESICVLNKEDKEKIEKIMDTFSEEGLRTIAVAISSGNAWTFAGIIGLYDTPRPDSALFINELRELSIEPKMLTGDNVKIAREIAKEINLGSNIVDMEELRSRNEKGIDDVNGFANIYPEDKYIIVKSLQKEGRVIGMTGDGVNDAPALKQAEVGIAVSNATDVAKSAAGIVLTKDGISVIVEAVKESRKIFERMLTYTIVKISKVFQIILFIALVYIGFKFIPILPFALILLIFTNDFTNIPISTDNTSYSKSPDMWNMKRIFMSSFVVGIMMLIEAVMLLPIGLWYLNMSIPAFQTAVFVMLSLSDKINIYNLRERHAFWKSRPSNLLIYSSIFGVILTVAIAYFGFFITSISLYEIGVISFIALLFFPINDFVKIKTFKHFM